MALLHLQPGQALSVQAFGAGLSQHKTHALFKSRDLELIRLVLQAGKSLPPHKVDGDITVHCLEGRLELATDGETSVIEAGQLLFLPGGVVHSVHAPVDASGLVTIVLR